MKGDYLRYIAEVTEDPAAHHKAAEDAKARAVEDARLVAIHQAHPEWSNKEVAKYMPGRTSTQCDNRWRDKANPALRWGEWSFRRPAARIAGPPGDTSICVAGDGICLQGSRCVLEITDQASVGVQGWSW